ncbi:cupin domain-containing protein [Pseudoalteromonas sp. SWXJZ94C]|uniref:cupin domain-containing protein n=1 Tax=Pseudoalteromonas sp. SWXJZ94C TaxID=2792065 RepID=UPI0018CE9589|nr:cupin domain-containing protein [Pseudoalteromonas sp. SWXJZ94C]MBH0055361.1 cupin domain-containing protein [Pseudoalteromonas sp. SWXJZ94C]
MKIAADFSKRVVVHSETLAWVASPMAGVDRRALDRVGDEVARATTIVRYAPGSEFSPHTHTGGEEFVVLEGVFQDEHGDFPAGSYIRNPPESKHKPGSKNGCIIFVKLWQFQPDDRTHVRLQTDLMQSAAHPNFKNVAVTPLYKDTFEEVSLLLFKPNADMVINAQGGAELLVLEGSLDEQADTLVKNSWLRVPINSTVNVKAGNNGAKVWLKTGHLTDVSNQISRVQNT